MGSCASHTARPPHLTEFASSFADWICQFSFTERLNVGQYAIAAKDSLPRFIDDSGQRLLRQTRTRQAEKLVHRHDGTRRGSCQTCEL